jgi:hypothetical protein
MTVANHQGADEQEKGMPHDLIREKEQGLLNRNVGLGCVDVGPFVTRAD